MCKLKIMSGCFACLLAWSLTACGKQSESPAQQPMTEITAPSITVTEPQPVRTTTLPATTAVSAPVSRPSVQSRSATATSAVQTTVTTAAVTESTGMETDLSAGFTEAVPITALPVADYVRITVSEEEIMQAAGISADEMLMGILDVENTYVDCGVAVVSREQPRTEPEGTVPDWLYRVTEIAAEGVPVGQTVTISGVAIDNECDRSNDTENWYVARKIPFSLTKVAEAGN